MYSAFRRASGQQGATDGHRKRPALVPAIGAAAVGSLALAGKGEAARGCGAPGGSCRGRACSAPESSTAPMANLRSLKRMSSDATFPGLQPAGNRRSASRRCRSLNGIITPNGCSSNATTRTTGRRSASASIAGPRPGRAPAACFHDGRHHAVSCGIAHSFHRVSRQWRHGMARRTAQFAAVHARHDQLRGMDRRQVVDAA